MPKQCSLARLAIIVSIVEGLLGKLPTPASVYYTKGGLYALCLDIMGCSDHILYTHHQY